MITMIIISETDQKSYKNDRNYLFIYEFQMTYGDLHFRQD